MPLEGMIDNLIKHLNFREVFLNFMSPDYSTELYNKLENIDV